MHAVNDLVRRSKHIEYSDHGPLGIAARCVKFIHFTEGHDSGPPYSSAIEHWFAIAESQIHHKLDRVDDVFRGLTELEICNFKLFRKSIKTYNLKKLHIITFNAF